MFFAKIPRHTRQNAITEGDLECILTRNCEGTEQLRKEKRNVVMTLRDLPVGKTATIRSVGGEGALRQHFLDMGLIPQGEVTVVKYAPMGDPVELRIHSYELTLRLADAEKIEIENIRDAGQVKPKKKERTVIPHPGLGEGGKYHEKETEHPLPDTEVLTVYYENAQMTPLMKWFCRKSGKSKFTAKDIAAMKATAARKAADRNPYSWNMDFYEYPDGSGYEGRFTKCGICTLMQELGLYDLTPAMCHLDYAMSEAGGVTNFVRQYTLASGGPYCDCGYQKKRV